MENKTSFKENRIEKAKEILSEMFNIDKFYLENNTCRKRNIIEARRFFIYYLRNEIVMPYHRVRDYVKGLDHATAMHHCKKLPGLMEFDKTVRYKYYKFLVLANDFDFLTTLLSLKRTQAKYLNTELRELNSLFTEKRWDDQSKIIKNQYKL